MAWVLNLRQQSVEDGGQFFAGLLHAKPNETEAGLVVEDDDQDDTIAHQLDVDVRALFLVKLGRELIFAKQLRDASGGGNIAGRQRRQ